MIKHIFHAIKNGIRDMFQIQILWLIVWPFLAAFAIWVVLGFLLWGPISALIEQGIIAIGLQEYVLTVEPAWLADMLQTLLHLMHIAIYVPLIFLTALLITAFFAMPALVKLVEKRHYPDLKRESGGTLVANIKTLLIALAGFVGIFLMIIPFWFIGLAFLVPFFAMAYLNQHMFRFDALAEHASRDEMKQLFTEYQGQWWLLGLLTGFLQFIPFAAIIAPVLTGLIFIHFALDRLQEVRMRPKLAKEIN